MPNTFNFMLNASTLIATSLVYANTAAAQGAPNGVGEADAGGADQDPRTEVIVVRGQLREKTLQDNQSSVAVILGEALDKRDDFDLKDIFERTPNITSVAGEQSFAIRGVDARGVGSAGNGLVISVQVDGVNLPTAESIGFNAFSTWDLEQVEILRGPQSTQQGRNALAGAVVLRSKDPIFDYEFKARAEYGSRDTFGGAAAVNIPVVEDVLAFRISAQHKETDGFVDGPTLGVDNYDFDEATTIRAKALFEPTDRLRFVLGGTYSDSLTGEDLISFAAFPDQIANFSNELAEEGNESVSLELRVNYDISDRLKLESVTTYLDNDYIRDEDLTPAPFLGGLDIGQSTESFSQDIRLLYESDTIEAVLGFFATDISSDTLTDITVPALALVPPDLAPFVPADALVTSLNTGQEDTTNYAIYGEIELDLPQIAEGLSVTLGGRYDIESFDIDSFAETTSTVPLPVPFPPTVDFTVDTSYEAFLPKFGINYAWTDDISTGFTIQRGYRAGGVQQNITTLAINEFDPEYTWNYEFDVRAQFFDGRLTANANVYYTEWQDQQVVVRGPSGLPLDEDIVNAGASELLGGELSITAQPTDALNLFASLGISDTKFTDFISGGVDRSGDPFANAPQVTGAFGGRYTFANGFEVSADASYTGSYFSNSNIIPETEVDSRFLVNVSASYERGPYQIIFYARNLFDEEYLTFRETPGTSDFARAGEPLTLGAILTVKFGGA